MLTVGLTPPAFTFSSSFTKSRVVVHLGDAGLVMRGLDWTQGIQDDLGLLYDL